MILELICESCQEFYFPDSLDFHKGKLVVNLWCNKCSERHILCPACWHVHLLSASSVDRYLNRIERNL